MTDDDKRRIERINEISRLGRSSWIGLLAYLAFIFVTLLGVEDADFFVPSRQTQLPLVGVEIPTKWFFFFAPILGAALYVYLHLFLIKLWDEIGDAPAKIFTDPMENDWVHLSEVIHPWLVNDMATRWKKGAHPKRPLGWLSTLVTLVLVWVSGPVVLVFFWWWSMPAHNEFLTVLTAICLLVAALTGMESGFRTWEKIGAKQELHFGFQRKWASFYQRMNRGDPNFKGFFCIWRLNWQYTPTHLVLLVLVAVSWMRTEGLPGNRTFGMLAKTNLSGNALGAVPSDWNDHDIARRRHRERWCGRREIKLESCDLIATDVSAAANIWCADNKVGPSDCLKRFNGLVARFVAEWVIDREAYINNLDVPDQIGSDLRDADLSNAFLAGTDFSEARMEGADLREARMEQTNLSLASMEGAVLREARMEQANLWGARMERADLREARMEGADFSATRMNGADLREARMEGADLSGASMAGVDLRRAKIKSVNWYGAILGSPAQSADFRGARNLTQQQLNQMIGDKWTLLPDGTASDTGKPYNIASCWEEAPPFFEAMMKVILRQWYEVELYEAIFFPPRNAEELREEFLCGERPVVRYSNSLPVDAPYPEGHPLAERD